MAIDLCDAEAERLGACQRTGCDRLLRFAGGTAAGPIGRVGTVERVEVQQYLLGHPGGVRGVLRLALGLIGDLPSPLTSAASRAAFSISSWVNSSCGAVVESCAGSVLSWPASSWA